MNRMSHLEVPRFPRGFLLSERPVETPPTFVPGPILENFYVHPWTNVETAGDAGLFVIVLGHAVSTRAEDVGRPADHLLECLRRGECEFLQALDDYSGRHAIIFGSVGNIRVVTDATAMRAVFYAAQGGIVASHALLVEQALGGDVVRDDLPFKYGYPGNRTPYARTRLLTANTYYWLTAHIVRRFWPVVPPAELTVDEAARVCLDAATTAMRNMAEGRTTKIALTAGVDSRTVLAVGLNAGIDFETYTYGDRQDTDRDRAFAADLAATMGVPHFIVPRPEQTAGLNQELADSHYQAHHAKHVGGLMEFFDDPYAVAVTGNLLEIGRDNYALARKDGVDAPCTAQAMAELHRRTMGSRVKSTLEEYGEARFFDVSVPAFQRFIDQTGYANFVGVLDPFDQFYWEHWMGAWHGTAMNERDFYAEAFIPFNARRVFEAFIGVSRRDRDRSSVFYRMLGMVDDRLLDFPVNPKHWPPKKG